MKSYWSSLLVVAAFAGLSAHAIYDPTWERPVLRAELKELTRHGDHLNFRENAVLTMNRRDGARSVTSFTLQENHVVKCVMAPCPPLRRTKVFHVSSTAAAGCGSRKYVAREAGRLGSEITVVDHASRVCDDYKPYAWEVTVRSPREGVRVFGGTPEPVYTIQSN